MQRIATLLTSVAVSACVTATEPQQQQQSDVTTKTRPNEYVVTTPSQHLTETRDLLWAFCDEGDRVLSGSCMYINDGPDIPFDGTSRPAVPARQGYFCVTQGSSNGTVRTFAVCSRNEGMK